MKVFITVGSTQFPELFDAFLVSEVSSSQSTIPTHHGPGHSPSVPSYQIVPPSGPSLLLQELYRLGFYTLILQTGSFPCPITPKIAPPQLQIIQFDYKDSLDVYFEQADLIITHAGNIKISLFLLYLIFFQGAASLVEAMRARKPILAILNETLLDNHQRELAMALQEQGLVKALTVSQLQSFVCDDSQLSRYLQQFDEDQRDRLYEKTFSSQSASAVQNLYRVIDLQMGYKEKEVIGKLKDGKSSSKQKHKVSFIL